MKRYTTHSRMYKDQADCKNFGKQFDSMFDSMGEMFNSMSSLFNTVSESSITEEENKTIIKKGDKTYVINEDGTVWVDGKQMVEMCDTYNTTASNYYHSAADAPTKKKKDKTVDDRVFQLELKIYNLYWYLVLGLVVTLSFAVLLSINICK